MEGLSGGGGSWACCVGRTGVVASLLTSPPRLGQRERTGVQVMTVSREWQLLSASSCSSELGRVKEGKVSGSAATALFLVVVVVAVAVGEGGRDDVLSR